MLIRFGIVWLLCISGWAGAASAQDERITSFDSDVIIYRSGELEVTETIAVTARGRNIRRGIFRDFPRQRGQYWYGPHRVSFDVLAVTRNGREEPWRIERGAYSDRVYVGDPATLLQPGEHTYTLTYVTDRQIAFQPGHDELSWNVTGNFWAFPIDRASATIHPPAGSRVTDLSAVTGAFGERKSDASAIVTDIGTGVMTTTRVLPPGEGVTLTARLPAGAVVPPDQSTRLVHLWRDGAPVWIGFLGLMIVVAFYARVWWSYGKDPESGTIIPRYSPPEGVGPAACRYILNMGWDPKGFTAAIVNLAAKGFVTITEFDRDKFKLTRTEKSAKAARLSPGETAVARRLFGEKLWTSFVFRSEHHAIAKRAQRSLRRSLREDFENVYFSKNKKLLSAGTGLSAAAIGAMAAVNTAGLGLGVTAIAFALFLYVLYPLSLGAWTNFGQGEGRVISFSFVSFVGIVLAAAFAEGLGDAVVGWLTQTSLVQIVLVTGIVVLNMVFYHLMKAPSLLGREVMDHIEGFRLFLTVAEKDRLNFHNPPDVTPEVFETYLPFAIALDVENEWGEQFDLALTRVGGGTTYQGAYEPTWFHSDYHVWPSPQAFASDFAPTFGGSVVNSLTPPSATRGAGLGGGGFSGGGFSGGGGGGGGGGGW